MAFMPIINFDYSDLLTIIALLFFLGMVFTWICLGIKAYLTRKVKI